MHGKLTEQATIKTSDNTALTVVERHAVLHVWGLKSTKETRRYSSVTHKYSGKKSLNWQDISKQLESGELNPAAAAGGKTMTMPE